MRCAAHQTAHRRHGDALQKGVKAVELEPLKREIKSILGGQKDWSGKAVVGQLWAGVVDQARLTLDEYHEQGKALPSWKVKAAQTLSNLSKDVLAEDILVTVASLYLYRELRPERFVSDRAFVFQVVRRVRNMTLTSRGSWFDPASGKTKHCYDTPREKEVMALAQILGATFGGLGLAIAKAAMKHREQKQQLVRATKEAIMEIVQR
ncbi:hypothetical protein L0V05_07850 [Tabrizicola sp. J26]|uniref:hypothetical protein n=1 Tax=Alitabrizicola rongguiensis TaxID=2909234 RepID=UPI001F2545B9|nr:hypothetical protein [Tabrizicola rongguiensis]MCF1708725.1 hypothetical protein [Tabrizicola rongguiensis]